MNSKQKFLARLYEKPNLTNVQQLTLQEWVLRLQVLIMTDKEK